MAPSGRTPEVGLAELADLVGPRKPRPEDPTVLGARRTGRACRLEPRVAATSAGGETDQDRPGNVTSLLFLDIEASGLEPGSHPIEIGWCDQRGEGEAHLIRPPRRWKIWSAAAETVHRITREQLKAEGEPVREVARRAAVVLAPEQTVVLSDFPAADQVWLDRLLAAGGVAARPRLLDLWQGIRDVGLRTLREAGAPLAVVPDILREVEEMAARARAGCPPVHRALPDAQANAAIWRVAMKRIADVAVLWRAARSARRPGHPEGER